MEELTYWEESATRRWGRYLTDREAGMIEAAISDFGPGVALEVGCDGGRWCQLLDRRGWTVVGCDVNPAAIDLCRRRLLTGTFIECLPADRTLPVEDAQAQLLLVLEVAEVAQAEWFPAEAARVLAPGGRLVFAIQNGHSLRGLAYHVLRRFGERRRYRNFYADSYAAFRGRLAAHGLRMIQAEGFAWFPFQRQSNSRLIPATVGFEKMSGLRKVVRFSPFVAGIAVRSESGRIAVQGFADSPSDPGR
jgi:SAM-dependent methyltransferase